MSRGFPASAPPERAYGPRRLARDVFLLVVSLFAVAALWKREYSARAVLAPAARPAASGHDRGESVSEAAQSAFNNRQIVTVMDRIGLLPARIRVQGSDRAAAYIRSRISFKEMHPAGSPAAELVVSYRSREEADAIKGANALAQSLAEPGSGDLSGLLDRTGDTIEQELRNSRLELRSLSTRRRAAPPSRRRIAGLEDQLQNDAMEFASLEAIRRKAQAADRPPAPASRPAATPAEILQQQIHRAELRLAQLRQRYTDQYPDVVDAREQIDELRAKLARLPAISPPVSPPNRVEPARPVSAIAWINKREETLAAEQQRLESEMARYKTGPSPSDQSPPEESLARAYASERDRYNALLKARKEYRNYLNEKSRPLFTVVESANTARMMGPVTRPLFWLAALLCGLFAAGVAAFIARPSTSPEAEEAVFRKEPLPARPLPQERPEYRRKAQ